MVQEGKREMRREKERERKEKKKRKRKERKRDERKRVCCSSMFAIAGLLRHFPPSVTGLHVILQIALCHVCSPSAPLSSSHLPGSRALHFGLVLKLVGVDVAVSHMCSSVQGSGSLSQAHHYMLDTLVCQRA